jgi:GGDEF domain-containing protein
MSPASDLPNPETAESTAEQTALACYLSTIVAIGNSMAEVCPAVGGAYRERLLKLPRRLGFDATPQALRKSQEAVAADLLEYSNEASASISTGLNHARMLLEHLEETEATLTASSDLQRAFLQDLADHIETSAEIDDEAQLRLNSKRCAAGLKAYSRKAWTDKLAMLDDLRRRREEINAWLSEASMSRFIDPETGLLNRAASETRILKEIQKAKPFCVILVAWKSESISSRLREAGSQQIVKQLADRLAATIRPYDVIFRWSEHQLITIFEASQAEVAARARQISGWLGDIVCVLEIGDETSSVKTRAEVTTLEHIEGQTVEQMIARLESVESLSAA